MRCLWKSVLLALFIHHDNEMVSLLTKIYIVHNNDGDSIIIKMYYCVNLKYEISCYWTT